MRKLVNCFAFLFIMGNIPFSDIMAQEEKPATKLIFVHEDHVNPSKVSEYEAASRKYKKALEDNNVPGVYYVTLQTDEYDFLSLSVMENMADLDKNWLGPLQEKMGDEFGKLFDEFDQCYDSHESYTVVLDYDLSYMPKGMEIDMSKQLYRRNDYYYIHPSNYSKVRKFAAEIKSMYEKAGSDLYYRVYRSGFGMEGPLMMISYSAQSAGELESRMVATMTRLGDDFMTLMKKGSELTMDFKTVTGYMRPDLSRGPIDLGQK